MGKHARTHTHTKVSSPPSAVARERGCCCQVSCEFETAAERTQCALTTQSGCAAAQLPGTTGSIWLTLTWWQSAGQIHRPVLNVVWNSKPIIWRFFLFNYKEIYIYILKEISNICLDLKEWTVCVWPYMVYGAVPKSPVASFLFLFRNLEKLTCTLCEQVVCFGKPCKRSARKKKKQRGIKQAQTLSIQNRAQTNTAEPDV